MSQTKRIIMLMYETASISVVFAKEHAQMFQIQHGRVLSNCQQTLPRRWRLLYVLFNNDKILLPALQMSFVQQMFSAWREWRYSPLETWKEQCLLWTLLEASGRKQQRETKTKPHTRKICFPSYVSSYFILICSYYKLTSQVCCQSVDTSYGLSSSHEQCRFLMSFFLVCNLRFRN